MIPPEVLAGVRQIAPTAFELTPATAKWIRDNVAERAAKRSVLGSRSRPLRDLAPGGLAEKLGLKNGDRLVAYDGYDLSNPEAGLEAYAKFRKATSGSVTIERDGKRVVLTYREKP